MAMENGPFIGDFPDKTSIHMGFSIATFDYQRVNHDNLTSKPKFQAQGSTPRSTIALEVLEPGSLLGTWTFRPLPTILGVHSWPKTSPKKTSMTHLNRPWMSRTANSRRCHWTCHGEKCGSDTPADTPGSGYSTWLPDYLSLVSSLDGHPESYGSNDRNDQSRVPHIGPGSIGDGRFIACWLAAPPPDWCLDANGAHPTPRLNSMLQRSSNGQNLLQGKVLWLSEGEGLTLTIGIPTWQLRLWSASCATGNWPLCPSLFASKFVHKVWLLGNESTINILRIPPYRDCSRNDWQCTINAEKVFFPCVCPHWLI